MLLYRRMLHRAPISRWLNTALRITERPTQVELPIFLCPSLRPSLHRRNVAEAAPAYRARNLQWRSQQQRRFHAQADLSTTASTVPDNPATESLPIHKLPKQCTGCGALSQFSFPDQPGYYELNRKAVRRYLGVEPPRENSRDRIVEDALRDLDPEILEREGIDLKAYGETRRTYPLILFYYIYPRANIPQLHQHPRRPLCASDAICCCTIILESLYSILPLTP